MKGPTDGRPFGGIPAQATLTYLAANRSKIIACLLASGINPQDVEDLYGDLCVRLEPGPEGWVKALNHGNPLGYALRAARNAWLDRFRTADPTSSVREDRLEQTRDVAPDCALRALIPGDAGGQRRCVQWHQAEFEDQPGADLLPGLFAVAKECRCRPVVEQWDFAIAYIRGPMPRRFGIPHPAVTKILGSLIGLKPNQIHRRCRCLRDRDAQIRSHLRNRFGRRSGLLGV